MILKVVSPTNGMVVNVDLVNRSVTIYIPVEQNHDVFSPLSGTVRHIVAQQGKFLHHLFQSDVEKTGRVTTVILPVDPDNGPVAFWLEVGKGYVTDRVLLNVSVGSSVEKGERIGEILLGSLARVYLGENSIVVAREGDQVIGGRTILGYSVDQRPT